MNKNRKRGFTLIELLVVVLIIGILAAIAVPQYQKAVEKARMSEAVLTISNIQKGIDMYLLEHGWPSEGTVVNFVGTQGSSQTMEDTSIDIRAGMDCYQSEEGWEICEGHNYVYSAFCESDSCVILADHLPGIDWRIAAIKYKEDEIWDKYYENTEDIDFMTSVLASLESQGYRNAC